MSKVVYLMGAGASCGKRNNESGVPIVTDIPQQLLGMSNQLKLANWTIDESTYARDGITPISMYDAQKELSEDLEWLSKESSEPATIDTYARKLFLKKEFEKYNKLKRTLASFLLLEQKKNKSDNRYEAFLANILTDDLEIPNDITIVTWNYDSQFEIALNEYGVQYDNLQESPICLSSYDNLKNDNRYKIFKINGSASFDDDIPISKFCTSGFQDLIFNKNKQDIVWYHANKKLETRLSFAWEKSTSNFFYKTLEREVKEAQVLVVIGYTFPYFNRVVDRWLFRIMENLHTIIIQDPYAEKVKVSLQNTFPSPQLLNGIKIDPQTYVEQFIIPREL